MVKPNISRSPVLAKYSKAMRAKKPIMHARLLMRSALSTKPNVGGGTSGCTGGSVTFGGRASRLVAPAEYRFSPADETTRWRCCCCEAVRGTGVAQGPRRVAKEVEAVWVAERASRLDDMAFKTEFKQ